MMDETFQRLLNDDSDTSELAHLALDMVARGAGQELLLSGYGGEAEAPGGSRGIRFPRAVALWAAVDLEERCSSENRKFPLR